MITMKKIILLTLLIIVGLGNIPGFSQELRGPEEIPPGTLAVFEMTPPQETSWCLFTGDRRKAEHLVDTASHRIYFASPEPGVFTVVAATVADGKPLLYHKTFRNGKEENQPAPSPLPTPDPPDSLESWIKMNLPVLVKSTNLAKEQKLVAEGFAQVIKDIENQAIKTPQNAQTQIGLAVTSRLALAGRTSVGDWQAFLKAMSRRMETELGTGIRDLEKTTSMLRRVALTLDPQVTVTPRNESPFVCPRCHATASDR